MSDPQTPAVPRRDFLKHAAAGSAVALPGLSFLTSVRAQAAELGYLVASKAAQTTKDGIRRAARKLYDVDANLLGVVLNGLSPRRIEYYSNYRYYRSYKKYYGSQS